MKNIKHVFFDLDHTLWDFDKNSALTFKKIFELNTINVELNKFLKAYESINLKYWKLYREERVTKSVLRYRRLKDTFDAINIRIEDAMIYRLSEAYITYLTTFNYLFKDTLEILEYLNANYNLHIITNGFEEAQELKLINSNIKHYFKTITNSEMVGVKKPNPKIFNFAMHIANARPNESIMVGDSLEADINGAVNVGMKTIHFDYKNECHPSNKRIKHLIELKEVL